MKLLILSDLHLEFGPFERPADLEFDAVVLAGDIHCPGRLAVNWARLPRQFGESTPVLLLAGNHESYGSVMEQELQAMRDAAAGTNVHLLDGDAFVLGGVRFLGCTLWTDFEVRIDVPSGPDGPGGPDGVLRQHSSRSQAMTSAAAALNDYQRISTTDRATGHRRLNPHDTLRIHQRQRAWLQEKLAEPFDGPTVVITHHAPHRNSLAPRYAQDWASGGFVSELPDTFFDVPRLWVHGLLAS